MTRSNILSQIFAAVLFVSMFASALPASASSSYGNYGYHNDGYFYNGAYYDDPYRHDDHGESDEDEVTPSCTIKVRPNTVQYYGGSVTLEWESNNADWAYISDVGTVDTDGSMRIPVNTSKTIRMTVHNDDRSAECDTFVNVVGEYRSGGYGNPYYYGNYVHPQVPYVHLTQIPYTGFDFGPLGNAIYWMTLGMAAVAGAYLLVYQSGMSALKSVPVVNEILRAGRMQMRAVRRVAQTAYAKSEVTVHVPAEPIATPTARPFGDAMKVVEGDTPRIVIERE